MSSAGYIYLLKPLSSIQKNENVFKIGKTHRKHFKRFFEYQEGSVLLQQISCFDCDNMEKILLTLFNEIFIKRKDYGREYFEGDYKRMIKIINSKIKNEIISDDNIFFWDELNKDKDKNILNRKVLTNNNTLHSEKFLPVTINTNYNTSIKTNYGVVNISQAQDVYVITNPKILEFIRSNKLLNFENLILQTIEDYSNQKSGNILITLNEITHIYQDYQSILSCKKNFETLITDFKAINSRVKSTNLENFCSKHLNIKNEVFSCENCNKFSCSTKKGLQTHMRKCLKTDKDTVKSNEDEEEDEEDEN